MTDVATMIRVVLPLGSQTWMRCKFGLNDPAAHAGALDADAAEVLGLASGGDVVAERGLLAADFAMTSHGTGSFNPRGGALDSDGSGGPGQGSDFFLGRRIVGLGALDVAALLDQVADLVRRDRELALRAGVQGGGDQEVVRSPIPLG